MQAGKTLGMFGPDGEISAHANGGAVGAGSSIIPEDSIQLAQVPEKSDNTVWSIMGQPCPTRAVRMRQKETERPSL